LKTGQRSQIKAEKHKHPTQKIPLSGIELEIVFAINEREILV
jgi:hypothetical protein